MLENLLKKRLREGKTAFGAFSVIPSPEAVEILGIAGFDFVILDAEHGPASPETLQQLVRAAESRRLTPIVRVADSRPATLLRALDVGSQGIQVPQVTSLDEARSIVSGSKYHPLGKRGLAIPRSGAYGAIAPEEYFHRANEETLIVVQCESLEGLEALDEVLTEPQIDVVFFGPFDMSQSLGIPGQVHHEKVEEAAREVLRLARKHGKAAGTFLLDGDEARRKAEEGFQYITINLEATLLFQACRRELVRARGGSPKE